MKCVANCAMAKGYILKHMSPLRCFYTTFFFFKFNFFKLHTFSIFFFFLGVVSRDKLTLYCLNFFCTS